MCTEIVLAGSGGCMRELVWQMQEQNHKQMTWKINGYVDPAKPENGRGVTVGTQEVRYLGDDDYLLNCRQDVNVAVCVGSSGLRKKIAQKLQTNPRLHFSNVILGDTRICPDVRMGQGCIISMDVRISTNVTLGDFVFLNIGSTICHDGSLGDYVTLNPDVKLAGAVVVGAESELGLGTRVIQGIHIAEQTVTGAGCVIVRDLENTGTYVGVPARPLHIPQNRL